MLRIAIIGSGGYARHHIDELLKHPESSVVALVDPSEKARKSARDHFPALEGVREESAFESFMERPDCDAVLISTPHTMHADQADACFGAGLHVLCDKPLATSVADVNRMIRARDKSGKVGAIAYQRHGSPEWIWLRSLVQDGTYGRLRAINSHLGQQWLQFTRGTWRQQAALSGGGQLNDSGSHMIDVLLWATGLKAARVTAFMDYCGTEVDINSAVGVEFETGQMANLTIVGDGALWHERHFFWFEEAMIELADVSTRVHQRDGLSFQVEKWPKGVGVQANFIDAVLRGAEVLAPFECGLRTIELTEAAWRSHEVGAPVQVRELIATA